MQNYIYPLDPGDNRPDFALWSGWPETKTHLTTATEPTPYATDMVECLCGTHVWIAADGRRWTWDNEMHRCPPPQTPLQAAEGAFDEAGRRMSDLLVEARSRYSPEPAETLAGPITLDDFVIE